MNEHMIIQNKAVEIKEWGGQRVVTFKDIDTIHARSEGTSRRNFNTNRKYFIEGTDYFKICADEIRSHKIMELSPKAQEDVTLLTESGYLMIVKSFHDDLAWDVQRALVNNYFRAKTDAENFQKLSPTLQIFYQLFRASANLELRMEKGFAETNKRIDDIGNVIKIDPHNWRYDCRRLIYGIAKKRGGFQYVKMVYNEVYKLLETRAGVNLSARLNHRLERMTATGATKAEKERLNKQDVIASDKKLIEIYTAIVKEKAIKEGCLLDFTDDEMNRNGNY